jgi:hypothetical protein
VDTVFFHTHYGKRITEATAIRTDDRGTTIANRTERFADDPKRALHAIREHIISRDTPYFVVTAHRIHFEKLRAEEDAIQAAPIPGVDDPSGPTGASSDPPRTLSFAPLFEGRMQIDLTQLAWPFVVMQEVQSATLKNLAELFREPTFYDSMGSAEECIFLQRIYWKCMKRYSFGLKAEALSRDLGGSKFEALRELVGL